MTRDVLKAIEDGIADVLAGRDAPELARDLAALAHSDTFEVTAEITAASELPLAERLGAHAVRLDAELAIPRAEMRAALVITGHTRAPRLELLRAAVAERAAPLLATGLDAVIALGVQPGRDHFPRSELRAVELAAQHIPIARASATIAALTARAGRLGVRGARWIAADPELFAAIAGGWLDAARDQGRRRLWFSIPAIAFPTELAPARTLLERLAIDARVAISVGACVETVRGVLELDAIERTADFVEVDLDALAETAICQARTDRASLVPLLEHRLIPVDPFSELDPALAALLVAKRRPSRGITVRGGCVLGEQTLARLYELAIGGACVPARDVATVRVAHARRGVIPTVRARASELVAHLATAPRDVPDGPPPPPPDTRARDYLDNLVAFVERGQLTPREAVCRIAPSVVDALARPVLDDRGHEPRVTALGVAPGAGVGRVALTPAAVLKLRREGEPAILVVREVYGDEAAVVPETVGLVSMRGGRTSHAALVAANCGVPCVIDEHGQLSPSSVTFGGRAIHEGDWISIDGATGAIFAGQLPITAGASPDSIAAMTSWADSSRRLRVLANADTPSAIATAIASGAQGIGLVRTENMFLDPAQLEALRVVQLGERSTTELQELQRAGFAARLAAAAGHPITFRLLDASFYELLPHDRAGLEGLAARLGISLEAVAARVDAERPHDPAMSLRMSRLAVTRNEVERAQVDALAQAWLATPGAAPLRIMVPMVISGAEMTAAAARIRSRVDAISVAAGRPIPLAVGAMIETPRAALDAKEIAQAVEFFAYGSNDLTQFTLGIARSAFGYIRLDSDPSETLDLGGVGALIHITERLARSANPRIQTGVCGNLGADPRSIRAFNMLGLDYVSVPPAQLLRTRVAAATR